MTIKVTNAIERAKFEISADIDAKIIPFRPSRFADLHDFVDANEYGGLTEGGWTVAEMNEVQAGIDAWLKEVIA